MTILCIETSTQVCSVALWCDGKVLVHYINREGSNHAKLLPEYVEQVMLYLHSHSLSLDAVALSEGPGSYTGLRIGTSTAKGICYGLNIPLIPIPTLDVLCAAVPNPQPDAHYIPMLDARRMEVYMAIMNDELRIKREEDIVAQVVKNGDWLPEGEVFFFGDGADKCRTLLENDHVHFIPNLIPDARNMGELAVQSHRKQVTGPDLAYYEPFYLKEFIPAPSHVKGLIKN